MTTTTHPVPGPTVPARAAATRPAPERPAAGLAPPVPHLSFGTRCRSTLARIQRSLLATADDCPPILLYVGQRT